MNFMTPSVAALFIALIGGQDPSDAPTTWLSTEGKSASWAQATAAARELLPRIKIDDARVATYLPRIRERCRALRRAEGFDWKTITAVEVLEGMLEDLSRSETPFKRYAGRGFGFGYWSSTMQRLEAIWVQAPPRYDPAKSYQFFLYYKCGGGIHLKDGKAHGGYRPTAEMCCRFEDTFHAWSSLSTQVKGRAGAEHELEEATAELEKDFSIDPDRIFLSGFSDGGFTCLWLASRFPHLVAGIAPDCANWQYSNVEEVGLYNVPVLVLDGWGDGGYVERNFTRFHALSSAGYDIRCLFGHHGHSYQPYEDEKEFAEILGWARTKRRDRFPHRVQYATWNLAWHRAYWFSIERMTDPALAARVDAEVKDGNRIDVRAENVAAYTLALGGNLVDPSKPVTVWTNGRPSYSGGFAPRIVVEVIKPPEGRFVKNPRTPGDMQVALDVSSYDEKGYLAIPDRSWLAVRPTGLNAAERAAAGVWIPGNAKDDVRVPEEELRSHNLILFGRPDQNRVLERIAGDLPIRFGKGGFQVGRNTYAQPENVIRFIHPNPFAPDRYVIVLAANDLAAAARRGLPTLGSDRGGMWEFRSSDCVVSGIRRSDRLFGAEPGDASRDFFVFDSAWRVPDSEVLGTARKRFDYAALQRLKADASKEALDVDASLILSTPVPWNRWKTEIPEGPVTMNDLTSTHMFPEYVMLGEIEGKLLRDLARNAVATSILPDRRDPGYAPKSSLALEDIEPNKVYRVAIDPGGATRAAYRADPQRTPRIHAFASVKEFLSVPGCATSISNLRLSDVEFVRVMADYFKRHGAVSPRASSFDLREYLSDPELNECGAFDWLHLGAPGWRLHLGVKVSAEGGAFPRPNSKRFERLALEGTARPTSYDLSSLAGHLPVEVSLWTKSFHILPGDGDTPYRLSEETGAGTLGSLMLLRAVLTNKGSSELTGIGVLGSPRVRSVSQGAWPVEKAKAGSYYIGFRDGDDQGKSSRDTSVQLFLFREERPLIEKVVLPQAGFDTGLIGLSRTMTIPANGAVSLPLLVLTLTGSTEPKDAVDPARVLEVIRKDLWKALEE